MKSKQIFSVIGICFLSLLARDVIAQNAAFTVFNVKGRVQIEIPNDWTISDAEQRKRVQELSGQLTGMEISHTASLSAQSHPKPSRAMVRVSFLPLDPPITQADVLQEVRSNRQQVLADLMETWLNEAPSMWSGLAKSGIREVGRPHVAIEGIGGQTALVISYGRTSVGNPAETMRVTQYHVLMGREKVLITLSNIQGDAQAALVQKRLRNSIVIR